MENIMNVFIFDYISFFLGVTVSIALAGVIGYYWHCRRMIRFRVDLMQRLPMTLEQIDANLELQKAHHLVDICRYELEIAKIRENEADANAKLHEARSRIDSLNRKLEIFQIQKAAAKKMRQVRKIEEQLIDLDEANTTLDRKAD
jgi:chromosome segregation ATPase